MKKHSL